MDLSLNEVVVLSVAAVDSDLPRAILAERAAKWLNNPKYDHMVALQEVGSLLRRGLLEADLAGQLSVSRTGWSALAPSLDSLERMGTLLRAARATAGVSR